MITDRREPGVYVSIEDLSYVAANPNVGRAVYCVGVCKKGPHNRIVQVTSQAEFHETFGKPNFYETSKSHYIMDKAMQYSGRGYYVRLCPDGARQANVLLSKTSATEGELAVSVTVTVTWANSSTLSAVGGTTVGTRVEDLLAVGDWIFAASETADGYPYSKQILSMEIVTDGSTEIELDSVYVSSDGVTYGDEAQTYKFAPYETSAPGWDIGLALPDSVDDLGSLGFDIAGDTPLAVFGFYATGAGAFYNKYKIKGARNVELEKMYTDDDGVAKYKYLFMNVGVYQVNDDASESLVEGPWLISLTDETAEGIRIRDLSSGNPLYIEDVINDNSKLIHCYVGPKMQELKSSTLSAVKADELRKHVMLMLSSGSPSATNFVVTTSGLQLQSGHDGWTDGTTDDSGHLLFDDVTGFIYIDEYIQGLATQAYNCSLTGPDDSIAAMKEVTYPVYQPDYILTGNWPAATQNAGRQLADLRQDCIHLGDTGYQTTYANDLDARLNDVP